MNIYLFNNAVRGAKVTKMGNNFLIFWQDELIGISEIDSNDEFLRVLCRYLGRNS